MKKSEILTKNFAFPALSGAEATTSLPKNAPVEAAVEGLVETCKGDKRTANSWHRSGYFVSKEVAT